MEFKVDSSKMDKVDSKIDKIVDGFVVLELFKCKKS